MPRVSEDQRQRAFSRKKKTGCNTFRRIKCDDTHPYCKRCTSTGRTCDGYASTSSSGDSSSCKNYLNPAKIPDPSKSLSVSILGTTAQRRSFHFFHTRTAIQLSGSFGEDFWTQFILRAAYHEPTIKHAIMALGSLHERAERSHSQSRGVGFDDFTLREYNTAICSLVRKFSEPTGPSIDLCLIACVLFACLETMHGSYGSAVIHIKSGCAILSSLKSNSPKSQSLIRSSSVPYVPIEKLLGLFVRLDFQASQLVGPVFDDLDIESYARGQISHSVTPASFPDLAAARDSLIYSWHGIASSLSHILKHPSSTSKESTKHVWETARHLVSAWIESFEAFLANPPSPLGPTEQFGATVLKMQSQIAYTTICLQQEEEGGQKEENQMIWDGYIDHFSRIVSLAEDIHSSSLDEKWKFSIDLGIIIPLYEVASRCRDPVIRRRAIAVLKKESRQEGLWNSLLVAKIAEHIVEIEERGLGKVMSCEDVPDWARINCVVPELEASGSKGKIKYMSWEVKDGVKVWRQIEEVVEW